MSNYGKLGKNVALITIGNFASKLLSFFLIPLYTAVLSTGEFGVADLMTTTINLISPFFTLLISEAIMRYALDKKTDKSDVLIIGLSVTFSGFVLMMFFSPILLIFNYLRPYYFLFVLYYFAVTIHSLVSQFVKGIERILVFTLSGIFQTLGFILLNILLLVVIKIGVEGYLISLIVSHLLATVILWVGGKIGSILPKHTKINRALAKDMIKYSIPLIPNALCWWVSNSADKYLLTFFLGLGVTGIYSVSQRIPSMFSVVSTIFLSAWQISAIEDFGSEKSRDFFSKIYKSYSTLNIVLVSGLICFTRVLAKFLFAKDFYNGWFFVPVLVFSYLFYAMAGFLGTIYTASKKTKMVFISTIISAVSNIILNLILIPLMGGIGAAVATFVSYFLVWIIRLLDSRKILKLSIDLRRDIIGYVLIIFQVVLIMLNNTIGFILSLLILLLLIVLNINSIVKLSLTLINAIRSKISKTSDVDNT